MDDRLGQGTDVRPSRTIKATSYQPFLPIVAAVLVIFAFIFMVFQNIRLADAYQSAEVRTTLFVQTLDGMCRDDDIKNSYPRSCSSAQEYLNESDHTTDLFDGPPTTQPPSMQEKEKENPENKEDGLQFLEQDIKSVYCGPSSTVITLNNGDKYTSDKECQGF